MASAFFLTLISICVVSSVSVIGILTLYTGKQKTKTILFTLISFAVGCMLGDVFFHIFPELYTSQNSTLSASVYILAGIMLFFSLEHFLHWRHSCKHDLEPCPQHDIHPVAYINLISDGVHNFFDGLMIGASYLVSLPLGVATSIAILLHEIPQELGDFGILLHAGIAKRKALLLNLGSAVLAIVGGIVALIVGAQFGDYTVFLLAFTAGGFLYIAGSDLMPELHKDISTKKSFFQFIAIGVGIAAMYALTFLE